MIAATQRAPPSPERTTTPELARWATAPRSSTSPGARRAAAGSRLVGQPHAIVELVDRPRRRAAGALRRVRDLRPTPAGRSWAKPRNPRARAVYKQMFVRCLPNKLRSNHDPLRSYRDGHERHDQDHQARRQEHGGQEHPASRPASPPLARPPPSRPRRSAPRRGPRPARPPRAASPRTPRRRPRAGRPTGRRAPPCARPDRPPRTPRRPRTRPSTSSPSTPERPS